MRGATAAIALLAGAATSACVGDAGTEASAGLAELETPPRTEILWDTWGVPHVYARNAEELYHAFGWAQMENHAERILQLYGEARGRSAEYWGEEGLEQDRQIHVFGIPRRARRWLDAQSPDMHARLEAFAAGMNAWAEARADELPPELRRVLPVRPADPLAHLQRAIHLTFIAGGTTAQAQRWGAAERGSNAWAIAPSRSASGSALLLINPHLPWDGLFTWLEAHLVAPGLDAYGATLIGTPILGVAFNQYLGWTHTVNTLDGSDLYELELEGDGYRWDGEVAEFEHDTVAIAVRQEDGGLREELLAVRRSAHGPVVAVRDGRALAARVAGLDQSHLLAQYSEMMRARNLEEFESALRRLQMPFFNVVYADRDGHILYLFGGRAPRRPSGDWAAWQGVVPGTSSSNLWTETLTYDELPRLLDPANGWVQNANDPPWTATIPMALDPADFPEWLSPRGMGFRPQRSARMLVEDSSITFEELTEYKMSTRMEVADRLLDDLIPAARASGDARARRAADVLEAWDREADPDSRGAALFATWYFSLGPDLWREAWDEARPLETPDGLADPEAAVVALSAAAAEVERRDGRMDVSWGETVRLPGPDRLPASGGPGQLGIFRVTWPDQSDEGQVAFGGDSFQAVVEFSDPVRARVLLSYGNASRPGSPHAGDQLPLYSEKRMRPAWLSRAEVEANLQTRTSFSFPDTGTATAGGDR